jgi:hypothetical protein
MTDQPKPATKMRTIHILNVAIAAIAWSLCLSWMGHVSFLKSLISTAEMFLEVAGAVFIWSVVFFSRDALSRNAEELVDIVKSRAVMIYRFFKTPAHAVRFGTLTSAAIAHRRSLRRLHTYSVKPEPKRTETLTPALNR